MLCCESRLLEEFPQSMHMSNHEICALCVAKYLRVKILIRGIVTIPCPAEQCGVVLEYNEIKEHSGVVGFAKYIPLLLLLTRDTTNFFPGKHSRKIQTSGGALIIHARLVKLSKMEVFIYANLSV